MVEVPDDLDLALTLLRTPAETSDEDISLHGRFVDASLAHVKPSDAPPAAPLYHRGLNLALDDLGNIATICDRLIWMSDLYVADRLEWGRWWAYAALDVQLFHIELRSLFDYAAQAIVAAGDTSGQLGDPRRMSFRSLQEKIRRERYRQQLGTDLADVAVSCTWFPSVREIRDAAVHKGGRIVLFDQPPRILFQCYENRFQAVVGDVATALMFNRNVVDFTLYAGYLIGRTIAFLERLGEVMLERTEARLIGSDARSTHPGYRIIRQWIINAGNALGSVDRST
ncbi:MAG: hypothetical protein ACOC9P_01495 [bacterium]